MLKFITQVRKICDNVPLFGDVAQFPKHPLRAESRLLHIAMHCFTELL